MGAHAVACRAGSSTLCPRSAPSSYLAPGRYELSGELAHERMSWVGMQDLESQ